ncbi:nicotinate phosphoribosyltransferase [Archaeoglobales archaeon]|nr:MAG: nicotinate phosphoribosyltransferase [Archaeoglobales archaeon]
MSFLVVDEDDIKKGITTDKYFIWTERVLKEKNVNPRVVAEVTTSNWGVFAGLNDVLELMEGLPVDIYAMPEGCLFHPYEPVLFIEGNYLDFARYETPLLGFLCHASGVATEAFKAKLAAGDKRILSFGTRRQHPALAAMIERAAYIGGVDGVSNFSAEKYLGINSVGTMPHALIISFGSQLEAWKSFDEVVDDEVSRIYLVDTYYDEKTESILVVENLKRIDGVRLDTPSTRRGNFRRIIEEVKWELGIRGRQDVKIVISGGLSIEDILNLKDLVDVFGVGTMIAGARPIDFALDIVEKEGRFVAKRGKRGGKKQVYRNWDTLEDEMRLFDAEPPSGKEGLLRKFIENGKIVEKSDMERARELALREMEIIRRLDKIEEYLK